MAQTPLANLLVAPTAASIRSFLVNALVANGVPANNWRKGGGFSSILTASSKLGAAAISAMVTGVLSAPFLPVCPPGFLPILAYYVYGVTVNFAQAATGLVNLSNSTGSTYSKGAGQAVFQNSFTGVTYTNVNPFTIGPLATLTGIAVIATVKGSIGNATAGPGQGSIDTVVSVMLGVTVTNPAPVLGQDGDSPQVIRAKCQASIAGRTYLGPNGAYVNAVAKAINSSGNPVNVNRPPRVTTDPSTGFITIVIAAPSGAPTPDDVAAVQVQVNLLAEPGGITATVVGATVVPLSSAAQNVYVWATGAGTVPPANLLEEVEAATDLALANWPIGGRIITGTQGYLFANYLRAAIGASDGTIFTTQGLSDVPLGPTDVVVRTAATTFLIKQQSS
jgi:hypothetical protein